MTQIGCLFPQKENILQEVKLPDVYNLYLTHLISELNILSSVDLTFHAVKTCASVDDF